ncbi:3-hydroxybutyryl-CoA dehydratase [Thermanaeromonas toyohensis ToBE]|uniref:3-hydroxybutyryl-CoA dehydratase n=1 Tax=Thermanaeromonas toyohensis ToBE TaxID=698762 RepID=A0A1W1W0V4_9FIRM|nr:MaoC family dehydratase [Thermanaeromonas toyohensis]SMB99228.1 3-hydroxybutyryl-CoA dehydratase [Thermanaeromonas toyohensis ToBE]
MYKYAMIKIGDRASLQRRITFEDIKKYAELIGDQNPLHLDEEYARKTIFGRPIAHGLLTAGLISNLLGNKLPGPGTVYLSQTFKFRAPVFPGDLIEACVEVVAKDENKRRLKLKTECRNEEGKTVLEGEAEVMFMD